MENGAETLGAKGRSAPHNGGKNGERLWMDRGKQTGSTQVPHHIHMETMENEAGSGHSNFPLMELFRSRMISPMSGSVRMRVSTRLTEEMTVE